MKSRYISFAQVLKRKQPRTLLEMFEEWEENPRNKYILHLDQSNTNRSNQNFSNMISSKNEQGVMFDSWIEGLGSQKNQLNIQTQYQRDFKQVRKESGPKKIILTSRGKQNKNVIQDRKMNIIPQKSPNNIRSPAPQIEMINSKEFKSERTLTDLRKSPASYKNKEINNQVENSNYNSKSQKPINSFNLQKESIGSNLQTERNMKKIQQIQMGFGNIKEKDESKGELQKIINATDNIHIQIGQMAHHFVLEQKRKKQLEEQELLLSLQQQKRVSLKSQKKQTINVLPPIPENEGRQDIQKKLREEVKKQVGNFLKTNMSKVTVPTFGSKINQNAAAKATNESSDNIQNNLNQDNITGSHIIGNVGFSFSSCLQKEHENKHNQIPYLNIPEASVIPQIPQIQSQRNHSQANEQIYDFYEKWKQKQNIYYEKHENALHIQSVVYTNCNQSHNPYQNTLSKQLKQQVQVPNVVHNTFGKHQRQMQQNQLSADSKQLKSEEKPQILVKIPSNYKEMPSQLAQNKEIQLHVNENESNLKTEILCLSASPQPAQILEKQTEQYPDLKQFQQPNKEIDLEVQQNHETEQKEEYHLLDKQQELKKSVQIELNTSPKQQNINLTQNIAANEKPEISIQKANQIVQKNSPNQHSNSCKLNKVYSSPKQNVIVPVKIATTSQFSATQDHKKEEYKIPLITMKYNGGKFDFGQKNKKNLEQKKTSVEEKPQKQQNRVQITHKQTKVEERVMTNKIESYAYMKNTPVYVAPLKNSIKQQEKQEFQFDF